MHIIFDKGGVVGLFLISIFALKVDQCKLGVEHIHYTWRST